MEQNSSSSPVPATQPQGLKAEVSVEDTAPGTPPENEQQHEHLVPQVSSNLGESTIDNSNPSTPGDLAAPSTKSPQASVQGQTVEPEHVRNELHSEAQAGAAEPTHAEFEGLIQDIEADVANEGEFESLHIAA